MKETLVALVTLMGLLGSVDFLVHEKVCSLREKLPTHGALVDHVSYLVSWRRGGSSLRLLQLQGARSLSLALGHAGGLSQARSARGVQGGPKLCPACLPEEGFFLHSVPLGLYGRCSDTHARANPGLMNAELPFGSQVSTFHGLRLQALAGV